MGRLRRALSALIGPPRMDVEQMRRAVEAVYYAAASDSPMMDFANAKDIGINAALLGDLNKLRLRCRHEVKQNGLAKGMARIYANSSCGIGPRISVNSSEAQWNKAAERAFAEWAASADGFTGGSLGLQLHLGIRQLFTAGEYFLVQRQATTGRIRQRYLAIRPDRVRTPSNADKTKTENGVEVDADGIPTAYWIAATDADTMPGTSTSDKFQRVPAAQVIHVFYAEDPVQRRGEPWLAVGLPTWHNLRRYDAAQIAAAIVAAKFAAVLVNKDPGVVADAGKILPTDVLEIQDGQMLVPPPGYEPMQIDPKQPNSNATAFRRDQIGAAGAAYGMPVNIASMDSSPGSFASSRFDGVTFAQDGAVLRQLLVDRHLKRVWTSWLAEAQAAGVIPPAPDDASAAWLWAREDRHTDPAKQANADATRLSNATTTVGQICMENGTDREAARDALLEEVAWFRANNLCHPLDARQAQSQGMPQTPAADDEEDRNAPAA